MIRLIESELEREIEIEKSDYRINTDKKAFDFFYNWVILFAESAGLKVKLILNEENGIPEVEIKYYSQLDSISFDYVCLDYVFNQKPNIKKVLISLIKELQFIFGFNDIASIEYSYSELFEESEFDSEEETALNKKMIDEDIDLIKKSLGCVGVNNLNLNLTKKFFDNNFNLEERDVIRDLYYAICSYKIEEHYYLHKYTNPIIEHYSDPEVEYSEQKIVFGVYNDLIENTVNAFLTSSDYSTLEPLESSAYITEYTPDDNIIKMKTLTKKIRVYQAYEPFRKLLERRKNNFLVHKQL